MLLQFIILVINFKIINNINTKIVYNILYDVINITSYIVYDIYCINYYQRHNIYIKQYNVPYFDCRNENMLVILMINIKYYMYILMIYLL